MSNANTVSGIPNLPIYGAVIAAGIHYWWLSLNGPIGLGLALFSFIYTGTVPISAGLGLGWSINILMTMLPNRFELRRAAIPMLVLVSSLFVLSVMFRFYLLDYWSLSPIASEAQLFRAYDDAVRAPLNLSFPTIAINPTSPLRPVSLFYRNTDSIFPTNTEHRLRALSLNPAITPALIAKLMAHKDCHQWLAKNPGLPPETFRALAKDRDSIHVVYELIHNPSTPSDVLQSLTTHKLNGKYAAEALKARSARTP